jgi:hypothetical protein
MRRLKSKSAAKKSMGRSVKKRVAKKATAKRKAFNQQTGEVTDRAAKALRMRDKLIDEYVKAGMDPGEARAKAMAEMRKNTRKDWRVG